MALIGITADLAGGKGNHRTDPQRTLSLPERYCRAVERAGGIPVMLPPTASRPAAARLLDRLDGVIISGGHFDIDPALYGEKPIDKLGIIKPERTEFELLLARLALKKNLPLLGICGGAQAINVLLGGTLYQDIATQRPEAIRHEQSAKRATGGHVIEIRAGTKLARIVRRRMLEVNTTHHQAVKRLGRGLIINATAKDGLIEGIESPRHAFALGVQWHPEALAAKFFHQRRLFSALVCAARAFRLHS